MIRDIVVSQYQKRQSIKPCACGSEDIVAWLESEPDESNMMGPLSLEKIECNACGNIVWGGDDEAIADWNSQRYDN